MPATHEPALIDVDGESVELTIKEDYNRLRVLNPHNVVLLCFAIDMPDSLDNIREKVGNIWSPWPE